MKTLIQKTWTTKMTIAIDADGLTIDKVRISEDLHYRMKFEELGFDLVRKRVKTASVAFYFFVVFDCLFAGLLIDSIIEKEKVAMILFWVFGLALFSLTTIAAYYNRNKDSIFLTGGSKVLELWANKPDKEYVDQFVSAIHSAIREYYKNKFSPFDSTMSFEQRIHQLRWLRDMEAITATEFDELVESGRTGTIIGFHTPGSTN